MSATIAVRSLSKSFGAVRALDRLDLDVEAGEIHGFLGPNGAGKSTTLRILLGLLRADGGTAAVLGMDPWKDAQELHQRLAYIPGDVSLWPALTGGEAIDLLVRLKGRQPSAGRRAELLERFDLDPTIKGRAYSKGNRQKVAIVAALASDVELLLLDEPTSGLDPLMEAEFQHLLREQRAAGKTVLLSSHILSEVESLCDRVSIVRAGHVVESGSLVQLRHLTRSTVDVELQYVPAGFVSRTDVFDAVELAAAGSGRRLRFAAETGRTGQLIAELAGCGMSAVTVRPPTLEELFMQHYSRGTGPTAQD